MNTVTINLNKKSLIVIFAGMVILTTGISGLFYYLNYLREERQVLSKPLTQDEIESLVSEVSKIMTLPDSKNPIIMTIINPKRLRKQNQKFFKDARAGDKLLIFLETNQAILYSQKNHQILNIAKLDPETAAAFALKYGPPANLSSQLPSASPFLAPF